MTATVLWLLNNAHIITALYYLITIRNCFLSLINRINYFLFHFKGYRRDFLKKHMNRSDSKIWNMSFSLENCKISRLGNLIHSSFLQLEKKSLDAESTRGSQEDSSAAVRIFWLSTHRLLCNDSLRTRNANYNLEFISGIDTGDCNTLHRETVHA